MKTCNHDHSKYLKFYENIHFYQNTSDAFNIIHSEAELCKYFRILKFDTKDLTAHVKKKSENH